MSQKIGALPDFRIKEMLGVSIIGGSEENISPASLDLSLSEEVYRVSRIFLPRHGETVRELLTKLGGMRYNFDYPLERGVTYLARFNERLELGNSIYGYCNPKSSTGRLLIHVAVVADGCQRYDAAAPAGFRGELWAFITPQPMPVKMSPGDTASQLRLFTGDSRFEESELEVEYPKHKLLYNLKGEPIPFEELKASDRDGSLILTLDLDSEVVGYECLSSNEVVDFSVRGEYLPEAFFRPVVRRNGGISLRRDSFYILSTGQSVRVPPCLSCEMVSMDDRSGEFRSHYAGFIDPGWGWGSEGEGVGRPLTLEVKPFRDLEFRDNQPIAKIRFERMVAVPMVHYDQKGTSNYRVQNGPKLSKHFKEA